MNAGTILADYVNTHVKILLGPIIVPVLLVFVWRMTGSTVKVIRCIVIFFDDKNVKESCGLWSFFKESSVIKVFTRRRS